MLTDSILFFCLFCLIIPVLAGIAALIYELIEQIRKNKK